MGILHYSNMVFVISQHVPTCSFVCFREKSSIIPPFIVLHFDSTGSKKLPLPCIKSTIKIGNTVQHMLVYEDNPSLNQWVPLSNYADLGDTVSLSCKTEKDRDKRTHRLNIQPDYAKLCSTQVQRSKTKQHRPKSVWRFLNTIHFTHSKRKKKSFINIYIFLYT